jgi:hypothetical protein
MTSPGGSFREQLELVVKATTGDGEAGFARLTTAATTADRAAKDTGESVARAAQRVAEARDREADAAGKVRIAEQRLRDLRDKGVTEGARYVTAQEQLETAQRRQHTASRDLEAATQAQTEAQRKAVVSTDDLGESAKETGGELDDLKQKAAALAGGIAIGDWARNAFGGFTEGARSASNLARSMNATIAEGGQLATIFTTLGLEAGDLLEIQAEFANVIGADAGALRDMGAEVKRNADGTINYALTIQDALAQLQQIPDATERNRRGFQLFGEEGYKQLAALTNSSVDVREAFERVGMPFTQDDVDAVADFDAQMLELDLMSGELGRTLGRAVIPVVTGLVDAGQDLATAIGQVPGPILATGAAAVVMGVGFRRAGTEGTFLAGAIVRASAAAATFRATAALTSVSAATMGAALGGAAAGARGLMALAGGPAGLALIGGGTIYHFMSEGAEALEESARDAAVELKRVDDVVRAGDKSVQAAAHALVEESGAWERATAAGRGYRDVLADSGIPEWLAESDAMGGGLATIAGLFGDEELAAYGAANEIENQASQLEGLEEQQAQTQTTTKTLNDLIAEGTTGGRAFADAVREAAEAQAAEAHTTDLAEASIAAYNATTRDAIAVMLEMYQAQLGQRSGWQDVLTAMQEAAEVTEDTETAASEVEQAYIDLTGTVLDYANESANAAVEAARAAGTVLDPLTEAGIRADATMKALHESLNAPNLTEQARDEIQAMIDDLARAQESGDIEAILRLTGTDEAESTLSKTTEDRETHVQVESRGGPAVDRYLDGLASQARLSIVRVESRGGPAVRTYLQTLADADRLARIRVESRGGPAVDAYLDGLASQDRLAIIRVETRGGPAVQRYLDDLAGAARAAGISVGGGLRGGPGTGTYEASRLAVNATLDLQLTGRVDRGQLSGAERGRAIVRDVKAYEQRNGTGWRRS